jgi:hypothetical protein
MPVNSASPDRGSNDVMMDFDQALSRWTEAERAWARSELAFNNAVCLYLARRGPAPRPDEVEAMAAARLSAEESFALLCAALRSARQKVSML